MRAVHSSVVLHPCDANQTAKLVAAMADTRGIVFLRTLRPNTPVLYMSGLTGEAIQQVQHDGAPDGGFLEKPFSPKTLVARVREIVPPTQGDAAAPMQASAGPNATGLANANPPGSTEAVYRLESPVRCPQCGETITTLRAIRLLRAEVNFTSTLPRRGRVLTCPACQAIVPAELTNF